MFNINTIYFLQVIKLYRGHHLINLFALSLVAPHFCLWNKLIEIKVCILWPNFLRIFLVQYLQFVKMYYDNAPTSRFYSIMITQQ
jgi:hypothetical protein